MCATAWGCPLVIGRANLHRPLSSFCFFEDLLSQPALIHVMFAHFIRQGEHILFQLVEFVFQSRHKVEYHFTES